MQMEKQQEGQPPAYEGNTYPAQSYPPQQYPSPNPGGYPPPQQGYPLPQQGYPPPQQGYPAPQQGYPAPQQGYTVQGYPAQPVQVVIAQQSPPSNAILAWIACLCFCWPVGIVAVLKANKSDQAAGRGDMAKAREYGESARRWAIASMITAVVFGITVGVIYGIWVAIVVSNAYNYYEY